MIQLSKINDAAFWDGGFCLDCEATLSAEQLAPREGEVRECPECGSSRLLSATDIQAVLTLVDLEG